MSNSVCTNSAPIVFKTTIVSTTRAFLLIDTIVFKTTIVSIRRNALVVDRSLVVEDNCAKTHYSHL